MIEKIVMQLIGKHGMTAFIGIMLFLVLKWVMKLQEKLTDISIAREERLHGIIGEYNCKLGDHTRASIENQNQQKSANSHQRAEHEKQLTILDGIATTVGRINGLKKE